MTFLQDPVAILGESLCSTAGDASEDVTVKHNPGDNTRNLSNAFEFNLFYKFYRAKNKFWGFLALGC